MNAFSASAISTWGAAVVFLNVLLTRLGVPVPAVPILVLAGTAVANHSLSFWSVFPCAVSAALVGDGVWFAAGRRYGDRVFDTIARLFPYAQATVRTTRTLFERFGVSIVAVSKFVPGLGLITPPMMGTTRVDTRIYAAWDLLSATSWAALWLLGGVLVEKELRLLLRLVETHDTTLLDILGAVVAGFFLLRVLQHWPVHRRLFGSRRAGAHDAAAGHGSAAPVILDARPETIRSHAAHRIPRARPLDLASAEMVDDALGAGAAVVYCVCGDSASAEAVGRKMREKGYTRIRVIKGGLDAWRRRGYPITIETLAGAHERNPAVEHESLTVRSIAPKRSRR